jgi:hypothetical protein
MFIKELYTYNRKGAIAFIAFILLFIFLNIKWGAVAFPINEYGMYSGKYPLNDTQFVYKIHAGETYVDFTKLPMAERDKLQYSLEFYERYKANNIEVYTTMKRLMSNMLLGQLMGEKQYTVSVDRIQFANWFNQMLSAILHKEISSSEIYIQPYVWQSSQLNPVAPPYKIYQFVPEP